MQKNILSHLLQEYVRLPDHIWKPFLVLFPGSRLHQGRKWGGGEAEAALQEMGKQLFILL